MTKQTIENDSQEFLNVHKAASFLTVSVTTIRRWAQSGKVAGTKVGIRGDWRFTKRDLLKMNKKISKRPLDKVKKVDAIKHAQDIIAIVREPFLVLDSSLHVVIANPAFYKAFKVLKNNTEGRLVYELGNQQWNIPE